jgi:hypothetical protein
VALAPREVDASAIAAMTAVMVAWMGSGRSIES